MYIDKQQLLSDDQAVTVSAASTNIIDFGNDDSKIQALAEKNAGVLAQVHTSFAGGTSVSLSIQVSDSSTFSSSTTIYDSGAIGASTLAAGYKFKIKSLPRFSEQYLRAYYTVVGTMSAGKIACGLILPENEQSNGV